MDKATYLESFQTSWHKIAAATRNGSLTPLPSCPGWTMTTLLGHLGTIYISVARYIGDGTGQDIVNETADLDLTSEYVAWYEEGRADLPINHRGGRNDAGDHPEPPRRKRGHGRGNRER